MKSDPLQAVTARRRSQPEPKASIAAQAVFAGWVDHRTCAMTADATGRGHGVISLRVGRVLIHLEDREALGVWTTALAEAQDLAEATFGPVLPPPAYQPRTPTR